MRVDIEKQSKELSATINSLCRENAVLTREELIALLDSITSNSIRIVKPMRDAGIIQLRKEGRNSGTYIFLKQEVPVHWKVFYNILIRAADRNRKYKLIKRVISKNQPIKRSYDTWVTDSTDSRYTYI